MSIYLYIGIDGLLIGIYSIFLEDPIYTSCRPYMRSMVEEFQSYQFP